MKNQSMIAWFKTLLAGLSGISTFFELSQSAQSADPIAFRAGRHRVQPLCSVPSADYQYGARTPSIVVRSLTALPQHSTSSTEQTIAAIRNMAREASSQTKNKDEVLAFNPTLTTLIRPEAKLLQLANRSLEIAHCELSDLALRIEPNGNWSLSLRADQNRISKLDETTRNVDIQIKRNAFRINVRLLESSHLHQEVVGPTLANQGTSSQSSKASLAHIIVPAFWVQREAPEMVAMHGNDLFIAKYFDHIDEAEFEFFVILDPLTGSGKGVVQPWQRSSK